VTSAGVPLDGVSAFLEHSSPEMERRYVRDDPHRHARTMRQTDVLVRTMLELYDPNAAGAGLPSVFVYLADSIAGGPDSQDYVVVGAVRMRDGKLWPALGAVAPGHIVLVDTPRNGDDIDRLLQRLTPGDIVVIDALDLDRITAQMVAEAARDGDLEAFAADVRAHAAVKDGKLLRRYA